MLTAGEDQRIRRLFAKLKHGQGQTAQINISQEQWVPVAETPEQTPLIAHQTDQLTAKRLIIESSKHFVIMISVDFSLKYSFSNSLFKFWTQIHKDIVLDFKLLN